MPVTLEEVLSCPALPTLPVVAVKLLELTRDPDVEVTDIAMLVQQDQALAARVLRTVNSSYFALSSPCGSLDRAITLLGLETVKSLVLGFSLIDTTRSAGDSGFDLQSHWRRSLHGAVAARELALRASDVDPDEVFTAGLFQDVGVLALYLSCGDEYAMILESASPGLHGICPVERSVLGLDHAQVSSALAELWGLPQAMAKAIASHHGEPGADSMDLTAMVSLGRLAAEALAVDAPPEVMRSFIDSTSAAFENVDSIIESVVEATSTLASMFEVEVGAIPSVEAIMAAAHDVAFDLQMQTQRRAEQFATKAETDALTGVANRSRFDALLLEHGVGMAVVLVDADRFKSVNDKYGHPCGDAVLIELARRLTQTIGDRGYVCRQGGEEFAVLLPHTSLEDAMELAEMARREVESAPFKLSGVPGAPSSIRVTISIGVGIDEGGTQAKQVVIAADKALYESKRCGRNRVTGPTGDATANRKPVVVLVEDDPLAATLVKMLLMRTGQVTCEVVTSGGEAQSRAESAWREEPPAAFVIDNALPDTTGEELLKALQAVEWLCGSPMVVMTSSTDPDLEARILALGAARFLPKSQICDRPTSTIQDILSLLDHAQAA